MASVVEVFERRVDAGPARCAIRLAGGDVGYAELDARANAVAAALLARGGAAPVALTIRSPAELLAAELGALKAGRVFAPVNPLFPPARIRHLLDDLGAPERVCDRDGAAAAGAGALIVEDVIAAGAGARRPAVAVPGDALAYVLFTSGSTGRPKGFAHDRAAMADNLVRHAPLGVGPDDVVTLISADGFAGAISNPYLALWSGAALAPYSFKDAGVDAMLAWIAAHRVTVFYGFPAFLRQVAAATTGEARGVRLVYLGGETVLPSDLAAARRLFPAAALAVGLNSTETGLSCLHVVSPGASLPARVPVGRPVAGVEIAIVDGDELELRGAHIRPRAFRAGHAADAATLLGDGRRAFRTGDRIEVVDGVVFHRGRVDGMIKLRGVRIEAAEIEAAIAALPGVADVAVIAAGDDADRELAAFVVRAPGAAEVTEIAVRAAVARVLPAAMIPATVTAVAALPRTPNGKLDRRALPVPRRAAPATASATATPPAAAAPGRPEVEARVAAIWRAVLRIDHVAPDDDFFLLGGTSISALTMIGRVRRELGAAVPLAVVFDTPTAGALIDAVVALAGAEARP